MPFDVFAVIRGRAFAAVGPERLGHVNLYLDQRVLRASEQLGPAFGELRAPRPSVLVFADDEPRANFGHPLLYHVKPELRGPVLFPSGRRYAIFYAGMANTRHLNDMSC